MYLISFDEITFDTTVHWGTMNANMYCDILKQSMIPSLRRLGRRQYSNMITTTALLKAEGKGDGLATYLQT